MARKKDIADRLAEARARQGNTSHQISELEARRNKALLADDDPAAAELYVELETLRGMARGHADKIALLEAEAEDAETHRRIRERAGLIARVEKKLAESDKVGADLQETLAAAERQFRRLIALREDVAAAWPWPPSDMIPALLSGATIARAVSYELYRIGARPFLGGRPGEKAEPGFPGGICPDHRLHGLPDQIPELADVLADASRHAARIMHGGKEETPAVLEPAILPAASNGVEPPVRTADQEKLAALYKRMAELAEDVTPLGDAAYQQVVDEIATLS